VEIGGYQKKTVITVTETDNKGYLPFLLKFCSEFAMFFTKMLQNPNIFYKFAAS